jgi:energy-coupling factor transport system permease protein
MNNRFMINYTPGTTFLHRLNGATKTFAFIVMTVYVIMTFDVRLLSLMFVFCLAAIASLKPNWKPIIFIASFMTIMAGVVGSLMIVLIKPGAALTHVGGETFIVRYGDTLYLSKVRLWDVSVMFFKRRCSLSTALAFILSVTPSELAAGLNAIGLPYKACVVVSLAFRTIPDIARDYEDIKNSLSMRGVELDPRRASLAWRLRQTVMVLVPLVVTSFGRVETIANAMDLRGFGKLKKRTWYSENSPGPSDVVVRLIFAAAGVFCLYYTVFHRLINPPPFDYWCPWIN